MSNRHLQGSGIKFWLTIFESPGDCDYEPSIHPKQLVIDVVLTFEDGLAHSQKIVIQLPENQKNTYHFIIFGKTYIEQCQIGFSYRHTVDGKNLWTIWNV